jgi:hypothetical protein
LPLFFLMTQGIAEMGCLVPRRVERWANDD